MRLVVWLVAALIMPMAAWAQESPYAVKIVGVADSGQIQAIADSGLRRALESQSRLVQLADKPASSPAALRRRAEDDVDRLTAALRAEGYYGGTVRFSLDQAAQPVQVEVQVVTGPEFHLLAFDMTFKTPPGQPVPPPVPLSELNLTIGERARSQAVVDAEAALLRHLAEAGYPLARAAQRRVVVDHAESGMRVELDVETGPLAAFGPLHIQGLDRLDPQWVRLRQAWRQGERFALTPMDDMRKRLVESRLFSSIKLVPGTEVDENGQLPLVMELREAERRSVGAGASWSSSEGVGGNAFWEHRNLFGGAEYLRASVVASEIRNAAQGQFRNPDFGAADQDLLTSFTAEEQRTKAYVTRTVGANGGLEWLLSKSWKASALVSLERTFEERDTGTRSFTLVSFPLEARQDSTDSLLDPTRGNRLRLQVRPFVEALGGTAGFTRLEAYESHYVKMLDEPRVVLAGWAMAGTIRGGGLDEVPADKRFYVGGGGSVRAFAFQKAGPVDQAKDPIGGLSALALGAEARISVTEEIGVAPFLEGGGAHAGTWPKPGQDWFWGGGLGLRYQTPLGPVRADFAVPFNPRKDVDDSFQVYLSLGQAF